MRPTESHKGRGGAVADRFARFHRCEGGQAIYVVVLFLFLLAGLLFLILNGGDQINRKVQMQSAADEVTATGATWFARGLNIICAANVTETHLLSLINLLDTLETVVPPAQECIDQLVQNIGSSKAGRDIPIDPRLSAWLVVGNAASEQQIMRQFGDIMSKVNWPDYLTYESGVLWECAKLMDGFSHAMWHETPKVVQREAMDVAKKNGADFGFVLPLWPELPVLDGKFRDFEEPMWVAQMPWDGNDAEPPCVDCLSLDHPPCWRHRNRRVPTPTITGFTRLMGYVGYDGQGCGPWQYWREPFTASRPMGLFDISRFSVMFRVVSAHKFSMLFGNQDDQFTCRHWEMDYDKAKGIPSDEIRNAWWEVGSFDARYPYNEAKEPFPLPAGGAWGALRSPSIVNPSTRTFSDMDNPDLSMYRRGTQAWEGADPREAVWFRCEKRTTPHYPQLGIFAPHPPLYPDGTTWPYTPAEMRTYWHVTLWRFNGVEKDTDDTLHRRYMPPDGQAPLSPISFDPQTGDLYEVNIRTRFTFNGFAYRSGAVKEWAKRFINPNPVEDTVAYAQARVYNRYSWDLFTQHFKFKLVRADRWKELIPELDKQPPAGGGAIAAALTPENLKPVRQNLEGWGEEFVKEVTH